MDGSDHSNPSMSRGETATQDSHPTTPVSRRPSGSNGRHLASHSQPRARSRSPIRDNSRSSSVEDISSVEGDPWYLDEPSMEPTDKYILLEPRIAQKMANLLNNQTTTAMMSAIASEFLPPRLEDICVPPLNPMLVTALKKHLPGTKTIRDSEFANLHRAIHSALGPVSRIIQHVTSPQPFDPKLIMHAVWATVRCLDYASSFATRFRRSTMINTYFPDVSDTAPFNSLPLGEFLFPEDFLSDIASKRRDWTQLTQAIRPAASQRQGQGQRRGNRSGGQNGRRRQPFRGGSRRRSPRRDQPQRDSQQQSTSRSTYGEFTCVCRKIKSMCTCMAVHNGQHLGVKRGRRAQIAPATYSASGPTSSFTSTVCDRRAPLHNNGDWPSPHNWRHRKSGLNNGVFLPHFSGTQKRRGTSARVQSTSTQPVCQGASFQNGERRASHTAGTSQRFHGSSRLERRVFIGSDNCSSPSLSPVYVGRPSFSIPGNAVWIKRRSVRVHQVATTGGGLLAQSRYSLRCIPRRLDFSKFVALSPIDSGSRSNGSPAAVRICDQRQEVDRATISVDGISRVPLEHSYNAHFSSRNETTPSRDIGGAPVVSTTGYGPGLGTDSVSTASGIADVSLGPSTFSCPTTFTNTDTERRQFPISVPSFSQCTSGLTVVVTLPTAPSITFFPIAADCGSYRDRCLAVRLGGGMECPIGRGPVGTALSTVAHQCFGSHCDVESYSELQPHDPSRHSSFSLGQLISGSSGESSGIASVSVANTSCDHILGLVLAPRHMASCDFFAGDRECSCRLGLTLLELVGGLALTPRFFCVGFAESGGAVFHRFVCLLSDDSLQSLFFVVAGSKCPGCGCVVADLDRRESICIPSVQPDQSLHPETSPRSGDSDFDHATLASSSLVAAVIDVGSAALDTTASSRPHGESLSGTPSTLVGGSSASVGGLEGLWRRFPTLSGDTRTLISASWRRNTSASYASCWKSWLSWSSDHQVSCFEPSVADVGNYLTSLFQRGLAYRTINVYRSALSASIMVNGLPVGQHPLILRMFKGIFNERIPRPRYTHTWSVSSVVAYLDRQSPRDLLHLSAMTAMALMLSTAGRGSDVRNFAGAVDCLVDGSLVLHRAGLAKTSRPGRLPRSVHFSPAPPGVFCMVKLLRRYIVATQAHRPPSARLLITSVPPYDSIAAATLARWIRSIMSDAGIDVSVFKPHSTRSAAASHALRSGAQLSEIMAVADWSHATTFNTFYNRVRGYTNDPIQHSGSSVV